MSAEAWLLRALIALGLLDLAVLVIAWITDRLITHTVHYRKRG